MKKTNAVRYLDKAHINYLLREFPVDESDLSVEKAAGLLKVPLNKIFKTLVCTGERTGPIIASIPGDCALDLKALARMSAEKKVEMVPLKEVISLTGYVRGAVSPLGIKHKYPYYLDEAAFLHKSVIISAGLRGLQIELDPCDLQKITAAFVGKIRNTSLSQGI